MKKLTFWKSLFLLCALIVGSTSAWGQDSWERVTSVQTLFDGGTFIMGYESSAKSGTIVPLRSKDCAATTSANGIFYTGTTDGSSTNGTISMSNLTNVTTSDYEVYITGIKVTENDQQVYKYINIQRTNNSGNYYGASSGGSSKNTGRLYTTGSSDETNLLPEWASETNNQFKLSANVSGTYKYLKFNTDTNYPRFAFYNSAGEKIVFYKKIESKVAKPTFNKGTDTYNNDQSVTLSCTTTGATIYYTTDGSAPSSSSTPYTGAITVNSTQTIKAIGIKSGLTNSEVAEATYTMVVSNPTFTIDAGTYDEAKSVELNCTTTGASIRYTTNGDAPTESSTLYEGAISVNVSQTIKAKAFKTGYTDSEVSEAAYTLKCATPTITKADGDFVTTKVITMASSDGATIRYTTDDSEPTTSTGTVYDPSNKPTIDATTTFKAIAYKDGWTNSDMEEQTFTKQTVYDGMAGLIANGTTSDAFYYVNLTNTQVTWTNGGQNGYIEDASRGAYWYGSSTNKPTKNNVYNGIFKVKYQLYNSMPEVKSFENIEGGITEGTDKAPTVMTPAELDAAFTANLGRQIKINNFTVETGKKLTENIALYGTSPYVNVTVGTTYNLIGYPFNNDGIKQFRVTSATPKPNAPTFSPDPDGGIFYTAFDLTLSTTTDGATIRYTTDGTTPTSTTGNVYSSAINVSSTQTIKAIAVKDDMESLVSERTFTYYAVKQPTFVTESPVYYNDKAEVSCETDGATLYYTLATGENEPADPTDASTAYPDGGITIDANTVKIKVIAKKGDDYSPVASATYMLKTPDAPEISPTGGAKERGTAVTITSRAGTTIYYTTNGDAPTNESTPYKEPIVVNAAQTIKAIAYDGAGNASSVATEEYTIVKVATPTFSVAAGTVAKGTLLTISTTTDGATIYYTLDGTDPTAESTLYNGYVTISKDETVKAIAIKANCDDSEVKSATYTVVGASETIVSKDLGYSNGDEVSTVNGTDVTLSFAKSTGSYDPKYYNTGNSIRIYTNNTLNIESEKNITSVLFTFYSTNTSLTLPTGQPGSLSGVTNSTRTWTGKTKSVTFSASATTYIQSITVYFELTGDEATVGTSKLAGYCSEYTLDFSSTGLKAYKAQVDEEKGQVILTWIEDGIVPAYEGVILSGDADDYDIPFTDATATTDFDDNEMVGVTQRTLVPWSSGGKYNYILQQGVFKKASDGYLKPNRAYLSTGYDVTGGGSGEAKALTIVFNDATTGINGVEEIAPVTKTRKVVKNGRLVIETPNGEFTIDGAKVK